MTVTFGAPERAVDRGQKQSRQSKVRALRPSLELVARSNRWMRDMAADKGVGTNLSVHLPHGAVGMSTWSQDG